VPLYEYRCPKCGTFEQMRKFSDPPLSACPTCGQPVEKLLSPPAIQFKGSGWYVTDYARKSEGGEKTTKESTQSKDTAAGAAGSSSETKGGGGEATSGSSGSGEKK
jgi:putative FmdB family regulatory protein